MTINWKQTAGALSLSVAMLSISAVAQVALAAKPVKAPVEEVVQPAPSVDVETGQLLDRGRPDRPKIVEKTSDRPPPVDDAAAPSTERGIKDNGVKGCTGCGITGREAAPPPVDDAAAPPSVDYGVDCQIIERDNGTGIANCPQKRPSGKATERRAHNGPGGTPPSTAKKGTNTGLILGITAGAAALAAVLVSGNNDDNPTSP